MMITDPRTAELVEVRSSGIHGNGAFARAPIRKGASLGFYVGQRLRDHNSIPAGWDPRLVYFFTLSDGSVIDGDPRREGGPLSCLNHSCEPNVLVREVASGGRAEIEFYAARAVRRGEELFIDYNLQLGTDEDPAVYACLCGSASCRGTMLGLAEAEA